MRSFYQCMCIGIILAIAGFGLWFIALMVPDKQIHLEGSAALLLSVGFIIILHKLLSCLEILDEESHKDSLTGILNRRGGLQIIQQEFREARKYQQELSLIFLDINNFKSVNDCYGHQQGDNLLCNLTKILEKSARHSDTITRWGGDEFLIILPRTGKMQAEKMVSRLKQRVNNETSHEVLICLSAGIASYPDDGVKLAELINLADERMYMDKKRCKSS